MEMKRIYGLLMSAILLVGVLGITGLTSAQTDEGEEVEVEGVTGTSGPVRIAVGEGNNDRVRVEKEAGSNRKIIVRSAEAQGEVEVETILEVEAGEENGEPVLKVATENGEVSVKIMPDVASERALEALSLNACNEEDGCRIVLKDVGQGSGDIRYEVSAEKDVRVLGIFDAQMLVSAEVDADSGAIVEINRPWWAIFAFNSR